MTSFMNMKTTRLEKPAIAILGSARSEGNTARVLGRLVEGFPCETVDLGTQRIAPFSYTQQYGDDDDFIALIERVVEAPLTVLATPVYWYSYSTPMKLFIDRFTDLLYTQKDLGRRLRGCRFGFLATGYSPQPNAIVNEAFSSFCDYLGITNVGMVYASGDGPFYDEAPVREIREAASRQTEDERLEVSTGAL
jgi:NAD(P)H-dependent FMN reductase